MLKQRVLTAIVMLAVLVASILISPLAFCAVMTFCVSAALWEWLRMLHVRAALPVAAVIGAALYFSWLAGLRIPDGALLALTALDSLVWLVIAAGLFRHRGSGYRLPVPLQAVFALTMLPLAWCSLMRLFESGSWQLVLSVLVIVWTADIAAYFCGRAFGRHRMAPAISPKKTWEGAAGAYLFGVAVAAALAAVFSGRSDVFQVLIFRRVGFAAAFLIIVFLTFFSMAGDLLESAAKRQAGIKDSSNLLPGHGGYFDRLDACIPVMPAAVLILLLTA
ncbi:phosphatidate cytidylyltransferase [Mesosutterella sp. AGMB02718]|uniref:Phosphatidate cytidylyltransferase n=1 Tax=Mesosutterella faecium TaxID=2925194 RepID=A0ABT7IMM3_9BURK|nr:phosphatidate cytidylyltransferase [Mesosutterella sp. AGMB02718]MDL2059622.1 phosphatidate cytidylyltransferase [Mesosutterella sp. AGMB02718]